MILKTIKKYPAIQFVQLAEIIKIKEICLLIQKEFGYKLFPRPHSASVLDQIK